MLLCDGCAFFVFDKTPVGRAYYIRGINNNLSHFRSPIKFNANHCVGLLGKLEYADLRCKTIKIVSQRNIKLDTEIDTYSAFKKYPFSYIFDFKRQI